MGTQKYPLKIGFTRSLMTKFIRLHTETPEDEKTSNEFYYATFKLGNLIHQLRVYHDFHWSSDAEIIY